MLGSEWIELFRKKTDMELRSLSLNLDRIMEASNMLGMKEVREGFDLWALIPLQGFVEDEFNRRHKEQSSASDGRGLTEAKKKEGQCAPSASDIEVGQINNAVIGDRIIKRAWRVHDLSDSYGVFENKKEAERVAKMIREEKEAGT